jgi:hypothetical protein
VEVSHLTLFLWVVEIEKQYLLAGFGQHLIVLHALAMKGGGQSLWITARRRNRLIQFAEANWLRGHVLLRPALNEFPSSAKKINGELLAQMTDCSFSDSLTAIRKRDIYKLAEAVTTAYLVQQMLGVKALSNLGELSKRYTLDCRDQTGCSALYVFAENVPDNLKVTRSRIL